MNAGIPSVLGGHELSIPGYTYIPGFGRMNTEIGVFKTDPSAQPDPAGKAAEERQTAADKPMTADEKKLLEACQDFEAIFLYQLLKIMSKSSFGGGLLDKSFTTGIYKDMMNEKLAHEMSRSGDFGLANVLYEQTRDLIIGSSEEQTGQVEAEG